jgi:hypothetical protein
MFPDIFNDDAFSLTTLTDFINNQEYVPGRAGEIAFAGTGMGVPTDKVALEWIGTQLGLIPVTARDAPAPQEKQDKGSMNAFSIPQVKLEDTINASQLFGSRVLGTPDQLRTAEMVIQNQIRKMNLRHDLTLEHLRLTALEGIIRDADGSPLLNLFTFFGVNPPADLDFSDVMTTPAAAGQVEAFITKCHNLTRYVKRNIKTPWPSTAYIHSFAGDNFFDKVVEVTRKTHDGWEAAKRLLGDNYAFGLYEFGGILWENYQGTDDNSTVAEPVDTARFFPVGIPGLYEEYYAPGDFLDVVGVSVGLPRYARIAPDGKFNRQVFLHTQANPIPIVTRPQTLLKATFTPSTESETASESESGS